MTEEEKINKWITDWICANEESDCYGAVTSWDDCCLDYEPKYGE